MQLMGLGLGFGVRGLGLKACGFRSYRVFRAWQKGNPSKWNFPNSEKNAYLGIYSLGVIPSLGSLLSPS